MTEPATGTAATLSAGSVLAGAGGLAMVNSVMPPGIDAVSFAVFSCFSIFGAFCAQFIYTLALRQAAEAKGVPVVDRPTIDKISLACAMCGAPMGTAALSYAVHAAGGATGSYSIPWYMAAGALAPQLSRMFLGAINRILSSRFGGS